MSYRRRNTICPRLLIRGLLSYSGDAVTTTTLYPGGICAAAVAASAMTITTAVTTSSAPDSEESRRATLVVARRLACAATGARNPYCRSRTFIQSTAVVPASAAMVTTDSPFVAAMTTVFVSSVPMR
ncbi:MAG: hypothetical protein CHACPFDD_03247 [Phycisphaerae bacterium]|nr:hypothetical protein [Phycisphaerae bacterium]